jgi:hypothetical protein
MLTGLHLNLTEGRPLSRPEDISSFLTSEGNFLGREGFQQAVADGHIALEEVCLNCSIFLSLSTIFSCVMHYMRLLLHTNAEVI